MNKKNFEIVVARYSEDLSWAKNNSVVNNDTNEQTTLLECCTIYNKGQDIDLPCTKLENIGHEGHTYIHHIIENYDNLADYTMFVQGDPFGHMRPTGISFYDHVAQVLNGENLPNFFWLNTHMFRTDFEYIREPYSKWPNVRYAYERVFGEEPLFETWIFGGGAQFCVSKEQILKRPLSFYQNIMSIFEHNPGTEVWEEMDEFSQKLLGRGSCPAAASADWKREVFFPRNPEIGVYMERFWGLIFDGKYTGMIYDHAVGGGVEVFDAQY